MDFFTWTIVLGKILTIDNLRRRGFILVNWCCLEAVNNLLLQFEYTSDLLHLVLNMFRVLWAMLSNILELLHCWKTQGRGHFKEAIYNVIPGFLGSLCGVFGERNQLFFEDCESNLLCLKPSFLRYLLD